MLTLSLPCRKCSSSYKMTDNHKITRHEHRHPSFQPKITTADQTFWAGKKHLAVQKKAHPSSYSAGVRGSWIMSKKRNTRSLKVWAGVPGRFKPRKYSSNISCTAHVRRERHS